VGPRPLSDLGARPLNFTVRSRAQMPRPIAVGSLALALSVGAAVDAQTQLYSNRDAARAVRNAENVLSIAVTMYRERLDPSQQAAFDDSQRRWADYRKATCDSRARGIADVSTHEVIFAICMWQHALERIDALIQLMTCADGDLSCPALSAAPNNRWRGP